MHQFDSNDELEMQLLYTKIVDEVLATLQNDEDWLDSRWESLLKEKIIELGKAFFRPPRTFCVPVHYLVEMLEGRNAMIQSKLDEAHARTPRPCTWVVDAMTAVGVPWHTLFDTYCAYCERVRSSDHGQYHQGERAELQAAVSVCNVIRQWLERVQSPSSSPEERAEFESRVGQRGRAASRNPATAVSNSIHGTLLGLSTSIGALHGGGVGAEERKMLTEQIESLMNSVDRFRAA